MSDTPAVGDAFAAMQLDDATVASASTNRHHFRFLDLAAGKIRPHFHRSNPIH